MGLVSMFKMPERGVYFLCVIFGLFVYMLLRPSPWAFYVALLVTYHLFLLYILFGSDNELRRSYNLPTTIFGHLVCVVLLISSKLFVKYVMVSVIHSLSTIFSVFFVLWAWKAIPVLQFFITYGLSTYERDFLFAGEQEKYARKASPKKLVDSAQSANQEAVPLALATGEDHHLWLLDWEQRKRESYRPGTSIENDFEQWLRARGKTQYRASSSPTA